MGLCVTITPIMYIDPDGTFFLTAILIGALVGFVVGGTVSAVTQLITTGTINWGTVFISALAGAVGGAFGGAIGAALYGMATGASAGVLTATSVTFTQAIAIGAFSSVAAGIGSRMVYNVAYNTGASFGAQIGNVFNAKAMAIDFAVGGATGGIMYVAYNSSQIMSKVVDSKLFGHNDGFGFKIGNKIEILYRNPSANGGPGGTFFSYKNSVSGGTYRFRYDWSPAEGFHYHSGIGKAAEVHKYFRDILRSLL